ncbi:MAG: GNAT family N-acetyltransferase [Propionibacteriaceae bacterium]|jgi:ribosomal protein S18 acetylase RimI-like enzyme|nr:GNAT family N-acetyltransferase [Propionibacteriaceae bacterium]
MPKVWELGPRDLQAALCLAGRRPVENVLVLSKLRGSALDPGLLGHAVFGYGETGQLASLLSVGPSLLPVEADEAALDAFARVLGGLRRANSIVGLRPQALGLWRKLANRHPEVWGNPQAVRDCQPVFMLDGDPAGPWDPRVGAVGPQAEEAYFEAAVAMYTEEIGSSPLDPSGGYRRHIGQLLRRGDGYGLVEQGRVLFKTDISVASGSVCQIGGVWLHPDLRGRHLAAPLLAGVIRLVRRRWPICSLYVNDYNATALSLYRRLGFAQINLAATVLW